MKICGEYIWLEKNGFKSKTKILEVAGSEFDPRKELPDWSTVNEKGESITLDPAYYLVDPIRGKGSVCVVCDTYKDGVATEDNFRAKLWPQFSELARINSVYAYQSFGISWPGSATSYNAAVSNAIEEFTKACVEANLGLDFVDATGAPTTIEYGLDTSFAPDQGGAISTADRLIMSRYLLDKIVVKNDLNVISNKDHSTRLAIVVEKEDGEQEAITLSGLGNDSPYKMLLDCINKPAKKEIKPQRKGK